MSGSDKASGSPQLPANTPANTVQNVQPGRPVGPVQGRGK